MEEALHRPRSLNDVVARRRALAVCLADNRAHAQECRGAVEDGKDRLSEAGQGRRGPARGRVTQLEAALCLLDGQRLGKLHLALAPGRAQKARVKRDGIVYRCGIADRCGIVNDGPTGIHRQGLNKVCKVVLGAGEVSCGRLPAPRPRAAGTGRAGRAPRRRVSVGCGAASKKRTVG
eukprot:scaffold107630_cov59-Phaeocystis_antarctica.AAC.2